ncbi:MerR family transcriptional regulator [Roseospira navarrensis]|uniref:MerR family transcriptional regulator n=1 Tax=Roseospira navarrensis TaxID=140058 RepID=UPI0031B5C56E
MADGQAREGAGRRTQKSDAAFRTISEVAAELDVPQHVLRFWETKFSQIRPMKRGGGRRYYRPEDVVLLTTLRDLLYREGYTIKGVQKLLRDSGAKALVNTVQERQERAEAEGGPVGPVGLALGEPLDSASGDDEGPGSEEAVPASTANEIDTGVRPSGLDADQRQTVTAVIDELMTLQGLLRQAMGAARAPTPPPEG